MIPTYDSRQHGGMFDKPLDEKLLAPVPVIWLGLIFSILAMQNYRLSFGWVQGITNLPVLYCDRSPDCDTLTQTVPFRIGVGPFLNSVVFQANRNDFLFSTGWLNLDNQDMCGNDSDLAQKYSIPNGLCDVDTMTYISPSAIVSAQALQITAVVTAGVASFTMLVQVGSFSNVWSVISLVLGSTGWICAVIAWVLWQDFSVPQQLLQGTLNTVPMYNVTIEFNGFDNQNNPLYRVVENSDAIYQLPIVGTPDFQSSTRQAGDPLWITGFSLQLFAMAMFGSGLVWNAGFRDRAKHQAEEEAFERDRQGQVLGKGSNVAAAAAGGSETPAYMVDVTNGQTPQAQAVDFGPQGTGAYPGQVIGPAPPQQTIQIV